MKTNDLRIGNHVRIDGKIVKVCALTSMKLGYRTNPTNVAYRYISNCRPVPLTDKLLEKVGFTYFDGRFVKSVCVPDFIFIEMVHGEYCLCADTINYQMKKTITTLHELETYYRLFTNTELKYKER